MPSKVDETHEQLDELYRSVRPALLRLAFVMSGSRELAEDVVQVAFASLTERWAEVDEPSAYLRRTVINRVKDHHRRGFVARRHVEVARPTDIPAIDETWCHISSLPHWQRQVVVLRYYEDLPLGEIAELLGRPAATVRSDLRRALERLRKVLR